MDIFDKLGRAGDRAMKTVTKAVGAGDPAVETYKRLPPQAFDAIRERYGEEGLLRYVKAMESRNLKGGNNG